VTRGLSVMMGNCYLQIQVTVELVNSEGIMVLSRLMNNQFIHFIHNDG
jgi:hypothetical protein